MNKWIRYIKREFRFNKKLYHLFNAVVANFYDLNNPLRVNNFGYSMRELLRNYLSIKAPDSEILRAKWLVSESAGKTDFPITRRHRFRYLICGGLDFKELFPEMSEEINEAISAILKKIDNLSKLTHINLDSFPVSEKDSEFVFDRMTRLIARILRLIKKFRSNVSNAIHQIIEDKLNQEFWAETFQEVDCLSTHSTIDSVFDLVFFVNDINACAVTFEGKGLISVSLQYGSNSDLENDIGALDSVDLPFTFSGIAGIANLQKIEIVDLEIDNSPFYGMSEGDL